MHDQASPWGGGGSEEEVLWVRMTGGPPLPQCIAPFVVDSFFWCAAFPFDKHALRLRILCLDCRFDTASYDTEGSQSGRSAYFATYNYSTAVGYNNDGSGTPPPPLVGGGLAYRTEYDTQCWGGNDVYMSATDLPTAFVMQ